MMRYRIGPLWVDEGHKAEWERDPESRPPIYLTQEFDREDLERAKHLQREYDASNGNGVSPEDRCEGRILAALAWLLVHRHTDGVPTEYVDNA